MKFILAFAVVSMLTTVGLSVPTCDGIWTEFYNVGNPLKNGDDDETLARVRKLHPEVCAKPTKIDVRLVNPEDPEFPFWYSGFNHIEKHHRTENFGFLCLAKLQQKHDKDACKDYKIRFCCDYPEPSCPSSKAYWTKWFDRDNPSVTGDYETLTELRKENPGLICDSPLNIQAQLVSTGKPYQVAGEKVTINTREGFYCKKKLQKDNQCHDYKVRFCCLAEPPCPSSYAHWTNWYDRDDPSVTGDYETLVDLRRENPGQICVKPINVQAQLVSSGKPYQTAGEKVTINRHVGFYCKRKHQKDNECHDYKARFCCEKVPRCPSGTHTWTRWFDRDDPSVTGDYETLHDLRKQYRGQICDNPINIHAQLTSGEPYQFAKEKVTLNLRQGFYCKKRDQKDGKCHDYKVRFCCQRSSSGSWTSWYNVNSPKLGGGDFETLQKLRAARKRVCSNPTKIQAVRVRDHVDARRTGEVIAAYNTAQGFICINSQQKPKNYRPQICSDYKVRFFCPIRLFKVYGK